MTDCAPAFIDHLRALGIGPSDPSEIIADDKKRRYRLHDDKPRVRTGSYQLRQEADGFACGWARSFREGITHNWHSKARSKASAEDREAWRQRVEADRAAKDAEQARIAQQAAVKAGEIWDRAARTGTAPYLDRKGITKLHGARLHRDLVAVPMRVNGAITGLQFIAPDGTKRFLTGSAKDGAYHAMADKGEPLDVIVIAEGYATACKLREALGVPVIVAFDAGNLKPVARAINAKNPQARIIFAADNDQWTMTPTINPGITLAQQAAVSIGGARVIAPQFPADDPERRTDWDDVARADGLDPIRAAFADAIAPEPEPMPEPMPEPEQMRDAEPEYEPDSPDDPFDTVRPLGHDGDEYVFFPKRKGQIVRLTASGMSRIQNLYKLAPRGFWERNYSDNGKSSDSAICAMASAHLMEACHQIGVYSTANTRGVGAWIDGGIAIVNCGDVVITSDGRRAHPAEFKGDYVYESGSRAVKLDIEPASNKEAAKLLDLCKMLKFKRPQYGVLLAGWIVCAPIGGALRWCPHIWLTGRAGSGKSWVLNNIIAPAIGRIGIKRDGGTSEAGIRKALGISSRPYMLDEAESQNAQRQIETEKILALLRGASSGSIVENAYATYQVKSCFALAAIIPRIEQVADKERITLLELLKNEATSRDEDFEAIEDSAQSLLTPEYADILLARTIENIETLLKNVAVFSKAAAKEFGNKRSGDQLGPMIAGAYSLTTTRAISLEAARAWIAKQNWDWHVDSYEDSDAAKLVTYIMTSRVRYDMDGMSREATIGDLVQHVKDTTSPAWIAADKALRSYGLQVKGDELLIANTAPNLRKLLKDTQYIPWSRTLQDFTGARAYGKPVYFMPGLTSRAMALPLIEVMGGDVELSIDADDADGFR